MAATSPSQPSRAEGVMFDSIANGVWRIEKTAGGEPHRDAGLP
jgi:G:T/U-mismatch repair DNA glycosylase